MQTCPVCLVGTIETVAVESAFHAGAQWIVINEIPAFVCDTCGDTSYPEGSVARIQAIMNGNEVPVGSRWIREFAFASPAALPARGPAASSGSTGATLATVG